MTSNFGGAIAGCPWHLTTMASRKNIQKNCLELPAGVTVFSTLITQKIIFAIWGLCWYNFSGSLVSMKGFTVLVVPSNLACRTRTSWLGWHISKEVTTSGWFSLPAVATMKLAFYGSSRAFRNNLYLFTVYWRDAVCPRCRCWLAVPILGSSRHQGWRTGRINRGNLRLFLKHGCDVSHSRLALASPFWKERRLSAEMKDVSWFIASCHDALSCHQRFSKWRWDQWIFGPPKIPFMMSGWNHLIQSSLILDFHLHIPFACLQYLARFCKVTKAEFSVPDVWWRSNDVCWRISGPSVGRLSNGREAPELTTTRGCQIVLGVALLEYDCMTGWGRFIIRRLSPERGHTSVCCSRRVYDYMWCASQGRNEVRYFLHVFITVQGVEQFGWGSLLTNLMI